MNSIDTTYRFFQMEILAGDPNMIAEVVNLFSIILLLVIVFFKTYHRKKVTVNSNLISQKFIGTRGYTLSTTV